MRVKTSARISKEAPISRILGSEAIVLKRQPLTINSLINAETIEVSFKQEVWPEEHARLNLFPVSDEQFCLQLMYLQYGEQAGNATIHWFEFLPGFFEQYPLDMLTADLPFRLDKTTEQQFNICTNTITLLQQLQQVSAPTAFTKALQLAEISTHILRRALECIKMPFTVCPVPACRFLANDTEREKVMEAKRVIELSFDQPYTIKELSRKVAMNECYLKKGFKALVGKTIHEYQQELRISRAKELLVQPGFSVSDVANSLGYSSISHFSTAFKKATGLKPCELLR